LVDYNRQRADAMKLIDKFASQGKYSVDDICFFVGRETGFGKKFIVSYISECLDRKFFSKDKDDMISGGVHA